MTFIKHNGSKILPYIFLFRYTEGPRVTSFHYDTDEMPQELDSYLCH